LTAEYAAGADVAVVKLFRGRRTLVHRRLWPEVDALAQTARERVHARPVREHERRFLDVVERDPGIPSSALHAHLRLERRAFESAKRNLEQWLCTFGRERDDVDFHTHEPALFPWSDGSIARSQRRRRRLGADRALMTLVGAVGSDRTIAPSRLFPVAALVSPQSA
jgi:hypothetical protein